MVTRTLQAGSTHGMIVELRPPDPSNDKLPFSLVSNPRLMYNFMLGRAPFQEHERADYANLMQRVIGNEKRFAWWIYVNGQFAGLVATYEWEYDPNVGGKKSAKIYYVVAPDYQREGVATLAVKQAMTYLFNEEGFDALEVKVLARHSVGIEFARKLGFTQHERTVPDEYEENGKLLPVLHAYCLNPRR